MSKIKDLRNSEDNNISLIRLLEQLIRTDKTKYIEMFRKLVHEKMNNVSSKDAIYEEFYNRLPNVSFSDDMTIFELMFLNTLISWTDSENIILFNQFVEYNERTLIEKNDLTTYKSFDEISCEISKVDLKLITKEMESQVISLYSDDEWLVIKPLTYESSKKYGSNTKWCTTSAHNPEYFFRYTKNGILIYCINRKSGYKVAAYKEMKERDISFWNQRDERIDSFYTELPDNILSILRKELKSCVKPNGLLIDASAREKEMLRYLKESQKISSNDMVEAAPRRIAVNNRYDEGEGDEVPMDDIDGGEMEIDNGIGERDPNDNRATIQPRLTSDQILELLSRPRDEEGFGLVAVGREEYIGDRPENMGEGMSGSSGGREEYYDEEMPQRG